MSVGGDHNFDCVRLKKLVVVGVTFRCVKQVPADWDAHSIEFQMNDSSSCADNLVRELHDLYGDFDGQGPCACGNADGRFVRDATQEDLVRMGCPEVEGVDTAALLPPPAPVAPPRELTDEEKARMAELRDSVAAGLREVLTRNLLASPTTPEQALDSVRNMMTNQLKAMVPEPKFRDIEIDVRPSPDSPREVLVYFLHRPTGRLLTQGDIQHLAGGGDL